MPNFVLIFKRWAAILVARRFFVKQGYTKEQARKIARDVVSLTTPEVQINNVLDYFKKAKKQ